MTVKKLSSYLKKHWPVNLEQLLAGTYQPPPVKRVGILKPTVGIRKLVIPTASERFIKQAIMRAAKIANIPFALVGFSISLFFCCFLRLVQ